MKDENKTKGQLIKELAELRQRIADLGTAEIERERTEETLLESEERLQKLSDNLPNGIVYQIDSGEDGQQRRFSYISAGVKRLHGITVTEALKNAMSIYGQVIAEDRIRIAAEEAHALENMVPLKSEVRLQLPSGEVRWRLFASAPRRLPNNHIVWDGVEIDITDRKLSEQALKEREKELQIKAHNLEEANIALKVLLKKMDEDKIELEEKVLLNVKEMIVPYLEKLKRSRLDESQKTYISILESSLSQIISPFSLRLSSPFLNFTPKELQVANLLRQGKTNKEIGELLNSSPRTIACHRENIRKKLGLKNKKANLKSFLLSVK
jgi:PAS domain S-box-containing protein